LQGAVKNQLVARVSREIFYREQTAASVEHIGIAATAASDIQTAGSSGEGIGACVGSDGGSARTSSDT